MNQQIFTGFMEQRGMGVDGKSAGGMGGGYPLRVTMAANKMWNLCFTAEVEDWKTLRKELKDSGFKGGANYAHGHLSVGVKVNDVNYQAVYDDTVAVIGDFLRRQGIRPPQSCFFCGKYGCDAMALRNGGYDPVHSACLDQGFEQIQAQGQSMEQNGSYLTGILGGLVGCVVGVIPSVLSILWVQRIYAMLYALIPLAIYQGYKMCKGRLNKLSIVITIALSVVGVYLIQLVLLTGQLMDEFSISLYWAVRLTVSLLGDPGVWADLTASSVMDFVFIALGLWIAWSRISRTGSAEIRMARSLRDTVLPYGSGAAVAAGYGGEGSYGESFAAKEERSRYGGSPFDGEGGSL